MQNQFHGNRLAEIADEEDQGALAEAMKKPK